MSYDLFFRAAAPLSREQFLAYFSERPRYAIDGGQAFYENEDTGVYFYFDFTGPDDDEEESVDDEVESGDAVAFNLNYFRPHFFGLEAAVEVAAFVERFGLGVNDPQMEGMGEGPFSTEGFLRGWNAGNRFAYRAILSQGDYPDLQVCATETLERAWRWNFVRESLQDEVGDDCFVPKQIFMKDGDRAVTAVIWPDAIPMLMPPADLVFILRDELAVGPKTDDPEIAVVPWREVSPQLSAFPFEAGDNPHFRLLYDFPPEEFVDFFRAQPESAQGDHVGLANDEVHNEENVAQAQS